MSHRRAANWQHVPMLPTETSGPLPRALLEVLAAAGAVVGPAWYEATNHGKPLVVVGIGVAASVLVGSAVRSHRLIRSVVVVAAAVLIAVFADPFVGAWVGFALVMGNWAVRADPPLAALPPPGKGALPAYLILSSLAAWRSTGPNSVRAVVIVGALTVVAVALSGLPGDPLSRFAARIGKAAATFIATLTFAVLGLFTVLLPWFIHRIVRSDPLGRGSNDTRWTERDRGPVQSSQPWAPESTPQPRGTLARVQTIAASAITIALIAGVAWAGAAAFDRSGPAAPAVSEPASAPAQAANEWFPGHLKDLAWLTDERGAWRPLRPRRLVDATTTTITVRQGLRQTWTPPPCECPQLTVWLYGGSAVFGVGQRDDHTIASELARLAHQQGIALTVSNRGVIGQGHWWEARRFSWDLSIEEAPDLAVFYDGYEDVTSLDLLDDPELAAPGQATDRIFEEYWRTVRGRPDGDAPKPPGGTFEGYPDAPERSPAEQGKEAIKRYEQVRGMSRSTGKGFGVPVAWVWQPTRWSRSSEADAPDDPTSEQAQREAAESTRYRSALANLPDDVIDLSSSLDDAAGPLFMDAELHNETAARLIASQLLRTLEPQLRRLAADQEPPS